MEKFQEVYGQIHDRVPLTGWLATGMQHRQSLTGWFVHASKPDPDAVPVVVLSQMGWWRRFVLRWLV